MELELRMLRVEDDPSIYKTHIIPYKEYPEQIRERLVATVEHPMKRLYEVYLRYRELYPFWVNSTFAIWVTNYVTPNHMIPHTLDKFTFLGRTPPYHLCRQTLITHGIPIWKITVDDSGDDWRGAYNENTTRKVWELYRQDFLQYGIECPIQE